MVDLRRAHLFSVLKDYTEAEENKKTIRMSKENEPLLYSMKGAW